MRHVTTLSGTEYFFLTEGSVKVFARLEKEHMELGVYSEAGVVDGHLKVNFTDRDGKAKSWGSTRIASTRDIPSESNPIGLVLENFRARIISSRARSAAPISSGGMLAEILAGPERTKQAMRSLDIAYLAPDYF